MKKVLLVDDDEAFRRSTARMLAQHGYTCVEAANSAEARAVLDAEEDVAALLCDIRMPGQSGMELLSELTADFPDLAVIMTTGVDDPRTAEVAFDAGAFGYVVKPFEANELLVSLASALRRQELESASRRRLRHLEQTVERTRIVDEVVEGLASAAVSSPDGEEELIDRLSLAVSLRDEETGRHIERMSRYCVVLAEAVGYTGMSHNDLRLATALHDVGKIGVPDDILLKPGSLSSDEYVAMQGHARIGYQLLAGSTSSLMSAAAEIALSHHEWWDGSGYPRGLRGAEIAEAARIAAVADVFDGLTSDRVYRSAMPFDAALTIMEELRGRQFEPRLFDALVESLDQITAIRQAYPDQEGPRRIRVLVVDDHEIFSQSLVRLLGAKAELKVVGTAGSVAESVVAAVAYQPDVILMDLELPDGSGSEATQQIKALTPSVKVIMLTARTDDEALIDAIAAGCSGFVKKEDAVDVLLAAIVAAHEGETISPPSELRPLLGRLRPTRRGLGADLTPRETQVLLLIAAGLVNKEIAEAVGIRLNTVRNHVQNILYKLRAHSKLEAVATAVREGLIDYRGDVAG
ncbi:MAG: cyclic di-GMP phosphodiesterase [Actinomycetota bacterium]|nr:cyclic di-GMP phosphodiesterase [Actinomycetota bacterium]